MIGDDFFTAGWVAEIIRNAFLLMCALVVVGAGVLASSQPRTPTGIQPIGKVNPYPPRPVLTECAFCDTPIIPGAIDTSCRNCGAPIKPIVVGAMKIKVPPPGPPATIYGAYEPFVPVGESIAQKLAQAIESALSEPKPPTTGGEIPRGLDDLKVYVLDDLEKSVDAVKRQTEQERRQLNNLRSLQRNPDALDHRLIGTVTPSAYHTVSYGGYLETGTSYNKALTWPSGSTL